MKPRVPAGESGTTLVETLVVVSIVGVALVAMLGALSTGALGLNTMIGRNQAISLAVAQMESVKAQPFVAPPTTYQSAVSVPAGYTITTEGQTVAGADANVQRLVVVVARGSTTVVTLEAIKGNHP